MQPAGLRQHIRALLACPECGHGVDVHGDQATCERCGYLRRQCDDRYPDLRPRADVGDPAWQGRQQLMEAWYRDIARDPPAAASCFERDYALLRPILGTLTGLIVDIGGGLGLARASLGSRDRYVIVDPSESWLDARWTALHSQFPVLAEPVDFIRGTGEALPLRSGTFDAVLSLWSLNHVHEPGRVVAEAHRVLAPRGRFVVVLEDMASDAPQPDHVQFTEHVFLEWLDGRFDLLDRRWIGPYLTFDLARRRAAVHVVRDLAANAGRDGWTRTLEPQLDWWRTWLEGRGLEWPADFESRARPDAPLQARIARWLPEEDPVSILDVGSGPLSRTGRHVDGRQVDVVLVDPLADRYRELVRAAGLPVPGALVRGEAEELTALFGPDRFDLVNAENALDHCHDPAQALQAMLTVVKPGGLVLLLHEENLADNARYAGAVPWNITVDGGRFILWNRDTRLDVTEWLRQDADVTAGYVEERGYQRAVEVRLRKRVPAATRRARVLASALPAGDRGRSQNLPAIAWTLIRTDFKVRYHGSAGGFLWALARPLTLFLVLQAVFSLIFQTSPDYAWNLVVGLFLWDFFAEASRSGLGALAAKAHLVTKVRVPAWLLVITSSANAVVTLALFTLILVAALIVSGRPMAPGNVVFYLLYLALFWGIVTGFALATSVLFLKYRDLNQVWDLVLQAGFFVAPIVYPLSILPERVHLYLYIWPPTPVIQFARSVLVDGVIPSARAQLLLVLVAAMSVGVGTLVFRRFSPRAAEYL